MSDSVRSPGHPRKFSDEVRRIDCYPMPLVYVELLRQIGQTVTGKPNITAGVRYLCQLYKIIPVQAIQDAAEFLKAEARQKETDNDHNG